MKKYIAGVDVGATHTKIAVLNLQGRIVARDSFLTRRCKKEALIKNIAACSEKLIKEKKLKKRDILGMGVGVPGLVDFKKGLVFYLVNITGWKNVPLKKKLERLTGLPVFIDNDVRIMALGEFTLGAGKGYKNVICITLGTGVGGAIIIDGRLYRGASLVAGEIGHIPINESGPACNCGGIGCIEAYVGMEYFLENVRRGLKKNPKSIIKKMAKKNPYGLTPRLLEIAANKGDTFSKRKWKEYGGHIGNALVGIVNFLNPELIVIGGGISGAGRLILSPIRKTIRRKAMKVQGKAVRVVKAKLGNDAGIIGAAELVKNNLRTRGQK